MGHGSARNELGTNKGSKMATDYEKLVEAADLLIDFLVDEADDGRPDPQALDILRGIRSDADERWYEQQEAA